ncbi:MAG: helix-turn-helix domain-containing protein, partial [Clostridia bacterium]|nr:helix-turn-helix domain-containing protein [Clostridia bacterium]
MKDMLYLKDLKKQNGLTNVQLAEKSGIPLGTINKIFSGKTKLSLDNYNKLLNALSCTQSKSKNYNYIKCALPSISIKLGSIQDNTQAICDKIKDCSLKGADIISFSELSLTGVTLGEFINQELIISATEKALEKIVSQTKNYDSLIFVGAPIRVKGKVYSCAVAILNGNILGITPSEFVETAKISFLGREVCFGNNIYKAKGGLCVACIVGDEYKSIQDTLLYAKNGANLIVHLCGSKELVELDNVRKNLVKSASNVGVCGYLFNNAGFGESSTDNVFGGKKIIAEKGKIIAESNLFNSQDIYSEIDLGFLINERVKQNLIELNQLNTIDIDFSYSGNVKFRQFSQTPFVPTDKKIAKERFEQILTMQALGLKRRIEHTYSKKAVIGISGGLDSTLALLVAVRCFKLMKKDTKDILGITMPCFGTSGRTYNNALGLCNEFGIELQEIKITDSVRVHFKDIGQDENLTDTTYENSQARERTQVLMDMANKVGGLV